MTSPVGDKSSSQPRSFGRLTMLAVTPQRDDAKALEQAADEVGFGEYIHVKDVNKARIILQESPLLGLVCVDLADADEYAALIEALEANKDTAGAPVLGLVPRGKRRGTLDFANPPARCVELLNVPLDVNEFVRRVPPALDSATVRSDHFEQIFEQVLAQEDARLNAVLGALENQVMLVEANSGKIADVNQMFSQITGCAAEDAIGVAWHQFFEIDPEWVEELGEELRHNERKVVRTEQKHDFEQPIPVRVTARLIDLAGGAFHLLVIDDLRRQLRLESAIEVIEQALTRWQVDDPAGAGLASLASWLDLDCIALSRWRIGDEGGQWEPVASHQREDVRLAVDQLPREMRNRLPDGQATMYFTDAWTQHEADSALAKQHLETVLVLPVRADDEVVGALLAARRAPLPKERYTVRLLRMAARLLAVRLQVRELQNQTAAHGLHDSLTHLPNRLLLQDRLEHALKEAERSGEVFAVLFIDLDRFKTINDSLGHSVGDQVLSAVAQRLSRSLRSSDTVARYAGDEFVVMLRQIFKSADVMKVATKLNHVLEEPVAVEGGKELQITASIGVSIYPEDGMSASELIKKADTAMYNAKSMGRNTAQLYAQDESDEGGQNSQKLVLEAKLRHASRRDELRAFYQPKMDARTEDIRGMEALLRWEHPELGLISPGFFIPLAEETGLILEMGEWVLRQACHDCQHWTQTFGLALVVSVNLSPLQLRKPGIEEVVAKVLKESQLSPAQLELEITESTDISEIPHLRHALTEIRGLGCRVSIDDFGTGHSSLDYIKRFPADAIKIDQSFVRNIGTDLDDQAIVEATISMAGSLKLEVVAEGVETEDHLEFLREKGCDAYQGFLFCRPLPAKEFERLLSERQEILKSA